MDVGDKKQLFANSVSQYTQTWNHFVPGMRILLDAAIFVDEFWAFLKLGAPQSSKIKLCECWNPWG